jgi:Tol biopolymer transport system component
MPTARALLSSLSLWLFTWSIGIGLAAPWAHAQRCALELTADDARKVAELIARGAYDVPEGGIAGGEHVIPVSVHIVRRSDGTDGISPLDVAQSMLDANNAFAGSGLTFCQFGEIIYIDSDAFYLNINTQTEIDALRSTAVILNTINVYFTENLALPGLPLCGISSFTFGGVQGIVMANSCTSAGGNHSTFAHEIGHYFDLFHTHETALGVECTNGSNCGATGDLLCDTPADPTLGAANVNGQCAYVGGGAGPCAGDGPYTPDPSNHMSYAPHACRINFSNQQRQRALATLVNLRPELIETGCSAGTFPPTPGMHLWSLTAQGGQAFGHNLEPAVSADGTVVVFESYATNLVPGDTNNKTDVFARDVRSGSIQRVSISSTGGQSNNNSGHASASADGRYIAFDTYASNLTPDSSGADAKIVRHDRETGETVLVSRNAQGEPANGLASRPAISADGRFVAFGSYANNLVPGDANAAMDVFLADVATGQITLVSVTTRGEQGNGDSASTSGLRGPPAMSPDARFITFRSVASNLVPGDSNGWGDVFVRDMQAETIERVSISSTGEEANGESDWPVISADGRYVAFLSAASNLVSGDTNDLSDIFVHDRVTGTTTRVSIASSGAQANGAADVPSISANGRYVAFNTWADLSSEDANGTADVYIHDRITGMTELASPRGDITAASSMTWTPRLSADGRLVVFASDSADLVPNDFNTALDIFGYFWLGPIIVGDVNGDGAVNVDDLVAVILGWGDCPKPPDECPADVDGSGTVDVDDLIMVILNWGP